MTPEQAHQFRDDVLNIVSQIPYGRVTTYGIIAAWAGWPSHSRMVGRTLRYTPGAEQLPCHRVVNKEGRTASRMESSAHALGRGRCHVQIQWSCRYEPLSLGTIILTSSSTLSVPVPTSSRWHSGGWCVACHGHAGGGSRGAGPCCTAYPSHAASSRQPCA